MNLSQDAKNFIRENVYYFDNGQTFEFFQEALKEFPTGHDFRSIVDFIQSTCNIDTSEALLQLLSIELVNSLEYYKTQKAFDDPSNGWSRLQWQLCGIGDFGLKYAMIVEYLDLHKDELGIKMIPLKLPYGWEGNDDYDLGWFNKEKFDQLYSTEEWY